MSFAPRTATLLLVALALPSASACAAACNSDSGFCGNLTEGELLPANGSQGVSPDTKLHFYAPGTEVCWGYFQWELFSEGKLVSNGETQLGPNFTFVELDATLLPETDYTLQFSNQNERTQVRTFRTGPAASESPPAPPPATVRFVGSPEGIDRFGQVAYTFLLQVEPGAPDLLAYATLRGFGGAEIGVASDSVPIDGCQTVFSGIQASQLCIEVIQYDALGRKFPGDLTCADVEITRIERGCGCTTSPGPLGWLGLPFALLALLRRRR